MLEQFREPIVTHSRPNEFIHVLFWDVCEEIFDVGSHKPMSTLRNRSVDQCNSVRYSTALNSSYTGWCCHNIAYGGHTGPITASAFRMFSVALKNVSLLKTRFERIDGGARQGSDTRQRVRTSRSGVCRARPSQAKREFALHCNRRRIS